jgi:MoxR-like ATPase
MSEFNVERFQAAARRFQLFFAELRNAFVEREDVLAQMAFGLLSKEHVLLTGPPGTAKSQLASSVLGRVVCETSGTPSLFARQITESTVQTDLIGPIDFKNLTETGRTTHFTDEGMLGSAHAFLDEVFDGRDMLLRSALNVLQERELKQGNVVTRGRIESALMTSNRYISEVLEESRETLLAFVDRIAFVGFVPRGFSDPTQLARILRKRMSADGKLELDALLTIQDLDVLQAAVENVWVAPELCDLLAELLTTYDTEVGLAVRADPSFLPTRYVSTRTAVRSASLLRAACVYEFTMGAQTRKLEASQADLGWLRLHLLLSGPSPVQAQTILEKEVDAAERRQLQILLREREIFDACLRKLPSRALASRPRKPPPLPVRSRQQPAPSGPASVSGGDAASSSSQRTPSAPSGDAASARPLDALASLELRVDEAIDGDDTRALVAAMSEVAAAGRGGDADRARAHELLARATSSLAARGMKAALHLPEPGTNLVRSVRDLVDLAASLEDGTASMHPTARWMHERALRFLEETALFVPSLSARTLAELSSTDAFDASTKSEGLFTSLEELVDLRQRLLSTSASRGLEPDDDAWGRVLDRAADELVAVWSRGFVDEVGQHFEESGSKSVSALLQPLAPSIELLDDVDARFRKVTGRKSAVKDRVIGPRLLSLVEVALLRGNTSAREELVSEVSATASAIASHGLRGAIRVEQWVNFVARALIRGQAEIARATGTGLDGYRELRSREQRVPLACTLAEIALSVDPSTASSEGEGSGSALPKVLGMLEDELRAQVVHADLARVDRALDYLEAWWATVSPADPARPTMKELATLIDSKVLGVVFEESALARFALETRLVEELLPQSSPEVETLHGRIEALFERIRKTSLEVAAERSGARWANVSRPR